MSEVDSPASDSPALEVRTGLVRWTGCGHSWDDGRGRQFTNTAVPRFDGTGCSADSLVADADPALVLVEQPFTSSEMGVHGRRFAAGTVQRNLEGLTADLLPAGADLDLIVESRQDTTLATVREWFSQALF